MRDANGLVALLGADKVKLSLSDRLLYRYDAIETGVTPLAVVLPRSTEDVVSTLRFAGQMDIPVVARGAASGLSGGAVPKGEVIVLATNRMNRLRIDPGHRLAQVQPGVVTERISREAAQFGLDYPPDPASYRQSTIGGNLAENAGGPQCLKKGVTGDYVVGLEVVTAAAEVLRLSRRSFDLAGLLIGSEGTLAVITEASLRLVPWPKHRRTLMAVFDEVGQAAEAVGRAIAEGVVAAKLEFMDQGCIRAVETAFGLGLPVDAGALLLVDTDGDDLEQVEEEADTLAGLARASGGRVERASSVQEAEKLWEARRAVSPAIGRIRPSRMNEDIVVPRSALVRVVRGIRALGDQFGLPLVQFGHIGDGNLHPNILYDPRTDDLKRVMELAHQIARTALSNGGVISGEHGIGITKRAFMREALDEDTLAAHFVAKEVFDPDRRMNPGKLLPEAHVLTQD